MKLIEDEGVLLKKTSFSENKLNISIFSKLHGKINGISYVKKDINIGSIIYFNAKFKNENSMPSITCENKKSYAFLFFKNYIAANCLSSMLYMLDNFLAPRHEYQDLYNKTIALIDDLNRYTVFNYCIFEKIMLESLGFGLDLTKCILTNSNDNLTHVSPKTGKAVCFEKAQPYLDKLLILPLFLIKPHTDSINAINNDDYLNALKLTGHFISNNLSFYNVNNIARAEIINFLNQ